MRCCDKNWRQAVCVSVWTCDHKVTQTGDAYGINMHFEKELCGLAMLEFQRLIGPFVFQLRIGPQRLITLSLIRMCCHHFKTVNSFKILFFIDVLKQYSCSQNKALMLFTDVRKSHLLLSQLLSCSMSTVRGQMQNTILNFSVASM